MASEHTVRQGECLLSIAAEYGLLPETVWEDSANRQLRDSRSDPTLLMPGDVVTIPDKRPGEASGETDKRHRFHRMRGSVVLTLRLLSDERPVADTPYVLTVGDEQREGSTDGDGYLEESIPAELTSAELDLDGEETLVLEIGALDPVSEVSGAQGRLTNLGLFRGELDGAMNDRTAAALREFQRQNELEETGELDDPTQAKLLEKHGC